MNSPSEAEKAPQGLIQCLRALLSLSQGFPILGTWASQRQGRRMEFSVSVQLGPAPEPPNEFAAEVEKAPQGLIQCLRALLNFSQGFPILGIWAGQRQGRRMEFSVSVQLGPTPEPPNEFAAEAEKAPQGLIQCLRALLNFSRGFPILGKEDL